MADGSAIEWTDATWNPITGCGVISPGCQRCYAMQLAGTRLRHHPSRAGLTHAVKGKPVWTGDVRFNEQWIDHPLRWTRPRRIFVCAHGDLFHDRVPAPWIDKVFAVMALAHQHTFQILTKRSERMRAYVLEMGFQDRWGRALPNVWLGVSVEDRARLRRIDDLRATPAAIRFVSFEPLLEDLGDVDLTGIDMAIVGGESGPGWRDMDLGWARSLRDQCGEQGVAFFMKQTAGKGLIPDDLFIRKWPALPPASRRVVILPAAQP